MNYLKAYREMAEGGKQFRGLSILDNQAQVGKFLRDIGANEVLDYGSGAGDAYRSPHKVHHGWGIKRQNVHLYDPSFPAYDRKPVRRFDAVICSDVLEHIPEEDVQRFIGDLFNHAKFGVWASVCCRPAKKFFPNTGSPGVNLHITVKPYEWWEQQFKDVAVLFVGVEWHLVETE